LFGGPVHGGHKLVSKVILPQGAQGVLDAPQAFRHQDFYSCVLQKPIRLSKGSHGLTSAFAKGLLQCRDNLLLREACHPDGYRICFWPRTKNVENVGAVGGSSTKDAR
jgi:hypothetical protein